MRRYGIAMLSLAILIGCTNTSSSDPGNPFPGTWSGSGTTFTFDASMSFSYATSALPPVNLSGTYSYTSTDLNLVFVSANPGGSPNQIGYTCAYAFSAGNTALSLAGYPNLTKQ